MTCHDFKGITHEYRQTDEYKSWLSHIKSDYPKMPDYLIEMAIINHKFDPKAYQRAYKESKLSQPPALVRTTSDLEILGAIKVYSGVDDPDLPILVPIKVVDV